MHDSSMITIKDGSTNNYKEAMEIRKRLSEERSSSSQAIATNVDIYIFTYKG